MTPDVYFYEAFAEETASLRRCLPASVRAEFTWATVQESGHAEPPAPLIAIRTQSTIPRAWAPRLAAVLSRSTGYDHLLAWRQASGAPVPCGYLPLYCARAVAEQAVLLWLALLRRLPRQLRQWSGFQRDGLTGGECAGRTLLVVGVGNIGHEVARIGTGLGMRVLGCDPVRRWPDIEYVESAAGLAAADVVVCAMNLTASNRGYFNAARLSQARPGLVFVNVARGEHLVVADLARLLDSGQLGGVGLDVYPDEPALAVALRSPQSGVPPLAAALLELAGRDTVLCTPHNAFNTAEALARKSEQTVQQVVHVLRHGRFLWSVPECV